jgi:hypothetical protein
VEQGRLAASTNGQAGELEQAVAELRENPYDLATLYNDFAVKHQVRGKIAPVAPFLDIAGQLILSGYLKPLLKAFKICQRLGLVLKVLALLCTICRQ